MGRPKKIENFFKPPKTPKAEVGYDNPRENIDPHIKTSVVSSKEGTVEHTPTLAKHITNKEYVDAQFPVTHASTTGQTTDDHHAQVHTIVSHDTTGTGAELTTLTDNSMADTLHRHSELSAADGTPDGLLQINNDGIGYLIKAGTSQFVIKTSDDNIASLLLGCDADEDAAGIGYDRTVSKLWLSSGGGAGTIASAEMVIEGGGNVGIGTSSPGSKLHIADGTGGEQLRLSRGTGIVRFTMANNSDDLHLNNNDASITYQTWKADGKVGINIAAPTEKLHVVGNALFDTGTGGAVTIRDTAPLLRLYDDNATANLKYLQIIGSSGDLYFNRIDDDLSSNSTHNMIIKNTGEVGIGVIPSAKFHIKNATDFNLWFIEADGVNNIISLNDAPDAYVPLTFTASVFHFNGGDVGIGVSSPTTTFSVAETIGMSDTGAQVIKLTNKSGVTLAEGQLVEASTTTALSVSGAALSSQEVIGSMLASTTNNASGWVQTGGVGKVRMDAGGSALGDRIISSGNTAGYGDVWNTGGAVATHFQEVGHALEAAASGALCRVALHFN